MEEAFLYRQVAEAIRQQILKGELLPGDRLPSVREMMTRWGCTLGTIQHAYQELARQGLIISRAGRGTHVVERMPARPNDAPLRRAALIHRAEAFLLEVLTAGYGPDEVESAISQALDRWRVVAQTAAVPAADSLHFVGSHDLVMTWLAARFGDIAPGQRLALSFTGSLGGLIALAEGKADFAGCHLWDEEQDDYNLPFIRRLLPGKALRLVTLAQRRLGLIVQPGNPAGLQALADLPASGLRFVNRQSGSGTRVWLDAQLRRQQVSPERLRGYETVKLTHSEIAQAIAEGEAEAGLGLEAAASVYGLGFIPLTQERYDLVFPQAGLAHPGVQALIDWLKSPSAAQVVSGFVGYLSQETGVERQIP